MKMPSEKELEMLRKIYPVGTKIKLICMNDIQAPPSGTLGKVIDVDDAGTIHVRWQNGSGLGLILGEDEFEKI